MLIVYLDDREIALAKGVCKIFCDFRQLRPQTNENGGIVLGQVSDDERRILISRASVPSIYDKRYKYSFHRNAGWAQHLIEYEFYNSGGKNIYLGEWHTHPADHALPSAQDRIMLEKQFITNKIHTPFILLFIAARQELFIGLYDGQRLLSTTQSYSYYSTFAVR